MIRALFILILATFSISCNENKVEAPKVFAKDDSVQVAKQNLSLDKIKFDFTARKIPNVQNYININATLSNLNVDTVYLYTWTDHGKQYSLLYDTTKFAYFPESVGNATYPIVEKIPPEGNLSFSAVFLMRKQENEIKLDYDFFRIESQLDMDFRNMDFNKTSSFERQRQKTILTGPEKLLNSNYSQHEVFCYAG